MGDFSFGVQTSISALITDQATGVRARVVTANPAADDPGLVVRMVGSLGSVNAVSSQHSTAVDPTYIEGSDNPISGDLAGYQRVRLKAGTTLSVDNFPTDQLVHINALDVNLSTVAKALTQTDGTQRTQVTNFPADNALTDTQLRATAVPVSVTNFPADTALTDTQLRATPVPVTAQVTFPTVQNVTVVPEGERANAVSTLQSPEQEILALILEELQNISDYLASLAAFSGPQTIGPRLVRSNASQTIAN